MYYCEAHIKKAIEILPGRYLEVTDVLGLERRRSNGLGWGVSRSAGTYIGKGVRSRARQRRRPMRGCSVH